MNAVLSALGIMGMLGLIFGALLTLADKMFHVQEDERVANVRAVLPGANCGGCGFVGCDQFAEAVVNGKALPNGCTAGGAATAVAVGTVLCIQVEAKEAQKARVLCQGTIDAAKARYTYDGYQSCMVAAGLAGGSKECRFACLGLGDCAKKCRFGAIKMENGIAVIDQKLCVGCGTCVGTCPRHVIELLPESAQILVRCRSNAPAKEARAGCSKACIACKRCEKECPADAIHVENGLARIDQSKCTRCGACIKVCPDKCITDGDVNKEASTAEAS